MLLPLLACFVQQSLELPKLADLIKADPMSAAAAIRANIGSDELKKGSVRESGTTVLFAVETDQSNHDVILNSPDLVCFKLVKLDRSLYAAVESLADGQAFLAEFQVDGKTLRGGIQVEVHQPNPYVQGPHEGMKGELRDMGEFKSQVYSGTSRKWFVYLPPNLDPNKEHPVLIGQDAQWDRQWQANALENCAREGKIPATVGVFIEPGQTTKIGDYTNRSPEYDSLNANYSKFLLNEILPQVQKLVKLSSDPAKRALVGMSSGGICSFTACWERPDQFGVALSFIGSFANIASGESKRDGGHNYPFLIRKTEKKPIRVFLQDGENDLNNTHGNWWLGNLQMESALKFAGYDYKWVAGKGFHSSKHARRVFDQALVWWLGSAR